MNQIRPFYDISLADGAWVDLPAFGKMLTIIGVSGADKVSVSFGGGPYVRLMQKLQYEIPDNLPFNKISLKNEEGTAITTTVIISDGRIFDNRIGGLTDVLGNLLTEAIGGNANVAYIPRATVTGPAVQILAAVTLPRTIHLQQEYPGNGGYVFYGIDNTVTAIKWIAQTSPIGSTKIENHAGAVWAIASALTEYVAGYTL